MSPQTIVFCCNTLWGLVHFRGRVIKSLVEDGHRVVLVARRDIPAEQALALGAEFFDWDVSPRGVHPWREAKAILSLLRMYRQIAPDIAFQFTIKPVIYCALISWFTRIRFVSVITGLGYLFLGDNWKSRVGKLLYRITLHRAHEVWFLNSDDRNFFEAARLINGQKARTLPGEGLDLAYFGKVPLPTNVGGFVFLMIARLVRDKGVAEYVEAAQIVKQTRPDAEFRLLGPAYSASGASISKEELECWISSGTINYLGASDDVRDAIAECHCVVLPSYREGMPRVLMEAAAMGRPAITTDVTGCRDVVQADKTGLLCKVRDSDSLAAACLSLAERNPDDLQQMGDLARQLAQDRFDDQVVIGFYTRALDVRKT